MSSTAARLHQGSFFLSLPWAGPPLKGLVHGVRAYAGSGVVGQCVQALMMRRMVMKMESEGVPGCCEGEDFQS